jgi:hypothetical protein
MLLKVIKHNPDTMKSISCYILTIFLPGLLFAQEGKKITCPDSCARIPIHKYSKGMRFYFPPTASSQVTIPFSYEYMQVSVCPPDTMAFTVKYQNLAGKTFEIASILTMPTKDGTGKGHTQYSFLLRNLNCTDTFLYTLPPDAFNISRSQEGSAYRSDFTIRGGIFVDDVLSTQKSLEGNRFYSLFPIRGKRFTEVSITRVEPGTWETPILVHFQVKDVLDSVIYLTICPTNVLTSYSNDFHFTKFFTCKNPKDESIRETTWDLIQKSQIKAGMRIDEVELSLGKPTRFTSEETGETELQEYFYPELHLYFKDKILTKIERGLVK